MNKNIFVIPSWYPDSENHFFGIFIREQIQAMGALRPNWKVSVSLAGQSKQSFSLRSFRHNLKVLRSCQQDCRKPVTFIAPNIIELRRAVIRWTPRIAKGNWSGMVAASLENLHIAIKMWGGVDIIHAHVSYPAGKIALELSSRTKIPYVVTEHMGPFPFSVYLDEEGRLKSEVKEPLENARLSIAVSPFLARKMRSFGLPEPIVIPNLVNELVFTPVTVSNTKGNRPFRFLTVCSMIPEKGLDDLIKAIAIMIMENSPDSQSIEFRLVGEGPEKIPSIEKAQNLGLSKYMCWLGSLSRDKVISEFQQCDAFILPSLYETFGVVYAEAMACGKPVIATRCGGPEHMVNKKNGLLVEVGNVKQLALAIWEMFHNAGKYDPQVIRDEFMKRFSRQAVIDSLDKIYNIALEN